MEPQIVTQDGMLVAGLVHEGPVDGSVIRGLWDQFLPRRAEAVHASGPPCEVWRDLPGVPAGAGHELMAGVQVSSLDDLAPGFAGWQLPAGTYARLTVEGYEGIGGACAYYWNEWLPTSPDFAQNGLFMLQQFCPAADGGRDTVHLLWPVRPKPQAGPAGRPTAAGADTVVLEQIGRIGFYRGQGNPEDHPLPGVVRAICEYLGDDAGLPGFGDQPRGPWQWETCALVHGVSGQGFHHSWGHWGPQETIWGARLVDMYVESLQAVGLNGRPLLKSRYAQGLQYAGAVCDDESEYRRWVTESIRNGMPVVALRLFGPPEPGLITGVVDDGTAIVGWDYFQDEDQAKADPRVSFDPAGRFVKRDWAGDIEGIILITGRAPLPEKRRLYGQALARDLGQMLIPGTADKPLGFTAYEIWVRDLLDDPYYAAADEARLRERHGTHQAIVGEVAERRAYAATFLIQAAAALPEASTDLRRAAECFDLMHDLCWRSWQTCGESHVATAAAASGLADAATRRELASIVLRHRDLDLRAAGHIRRALRVLGTADGELPALPAVPAAAAYAGTRPLPYFAPDLEAPLAAATLETENSFENAKYVRGVPPYRGFSERVCSLAGALETALATTTHPCSYAELMGYSGLAFRTRWFDNPERVSTAFGDGRWHPVSPHREQPDVLRAIEQATGWHLRLETLPPGDRLRREQVTTDLVLSVYAGLPVVAEYRTDLGVAYGYHIWSMNCLLRHQQAPTDGPWRVGYQDEGLHGPFIFLAGHESPPPDSAAAFAASLRLAVANHRQRGREGVFLFGPQALAAWRQAVAAADTLSPADRDLLCLCNWWTLLHLGDARRAAAEFLAQHRGAGGTDATAHLDAAENAYRREADLVGQYLAEHRAMVPWWGGTTGAAGWDAACRAGQAELLRQAAALEEEAIGALEAALAR